VVYPEVIDIGKEGLAVMVFEKLRKIFGIDLYFCGDRDEINFRIEVKFFLNLNYSHIAQKKE